MSSAVHSLTYDPKCVPPIAQTEIPTSSRSTPVNRASEGDHELLSHSFDEQYPSGEHKFGTGRVEKRSMSFHSCRQRRSRQRAR